MPNKPPTEPAAPARRSGRRPSRRRSPGQADKTRPALGVLPDLLGYQLRLAQRAIFADFADSMQDQDMSPGLFGILVIIEANPGLKQSELALAAHLDRSTVVAVVDKLEARRLVERRTAPEDRRVNGLWLTEHGASLLRTLKRKVSSHERRLTRNLTAGERQQLVALLHKILPERR
jgi:DNA-binding MarR family transcriptional regulator